MALKLSTRIATWLLARGQKHICERNHWLTLAWAGYIMITPALLRPTHPLDWPFDAVCGLKIFLFAFALCTLLCLALALKISWLCGLELISWNPPDLALSHPSPPLD